MAAADGGREGVVPAPGEGDVAPGGGAGSAAGVSGDGGGDQGGEGQPGEGRCGEEGEGRSGVGDAHAEDSSKTHVFAHRQPSLVAVRSEFCRPHCLHGRHRAPQRAGKR